MLNGIYVGGFIALRHRYSFLGYPMIYGPKFENTDNDFTHIFPPTLIIKQKETLIYASNIRFSFL